jgi:hypothetical protein
MTCCFRRERGQSAYYLQLALPPPKTDHLLQGGVKLLDFRVDVHGGHAGWEK